MQPKFREDKTTQAAAMLLRLNSGSMNYMKLIKLLYIIDRKALLAFGRPITFDHYVSMDRGPVLSQTLDLINEGVWPGIDSYWHEFISRRASYAVELLGETPTDQLSEMEMDVVRDVFKEYGHLDKWDLVGVVHRLPEWHDPQGSAIPIEYRDILREGGKTDIEASIIIDEIAQLAHIERILA